MATFNIGKDGSVTITVNGGSLNPLTITEFHYKQLSSQVESNPLNRPPQRRKIPKGWEGDLTYDRGSSALDDYFVQEESAYWAGLDSNTIVILCTVLDPITRVPAQYRYDNVVLTYEDGGTFKAEERVSQKVSWWASTMTRVA